MDLLDLDQVESLNEVLHNGFEISAFLVEVLSESLEDGRHLGLNEVSFWWKFACQDPVLVRLEEDGRDQL
jgi:hypothetical protein